ncbi:hypothetical protein F5X99DRAFT_369478 [Biscogniauxia marginata]|nr:hypothetical protein F5X99DRAFT_369478 [Biscogniauxia marginata]
MGDDILSRVFSRRMSTKEIKTSARITSKEIHPIVRTVQAGQAILNGENVQQNMTVIADGVNELIPKAAQMAKQARHFIPSIQIVGRSLCDSAKIVTSFSTIATTVGIGANAVLTYQGVQVLELIAARLKDINATLAAQTAMIAQKDFPGYVYDMLRERIGQTSGDPDCAHWFFVYHPDNDWYPKFYNLLESKPLGPEFCGYTNQIDTAFVFMLAARRRINEKARRKTSRYGSPNRPVRLHLLIPAYQPILIVEALKIPEEIGDFVMEGRINSNKEFVWLNLPEEQRHYVVDIGHWVPPAMGFWDSVMSKFGLVERPPELREARILGTRQKMLGESDEVDVSLGNDIGDGNEDDKANAGNQATPLHHHRRRRRRRSLSEQGR